MPDFAKKISPLKNLTQSLIDNALAEVRSKCPDTLTEKEPHFRTAEYFLLEAPDYVNGAWEMLAIDNVRAALVLSRWMVEAAMNLLWVVSDENETEHRLRDMAGEGLRQHANLCDDLAELWPDQAHILKKSADGARHAKQDIAAARLKPLKDRIEQTKFSDRTGIPNPYIQYRICCAAAHPTLRIWTRFNLVDKITVSHESSYNAVLTPYMAAWMAAASTLHLVTFARCLTQTADMMELKEWWTAKATPLLDQIKV